MIQQHVAQQIADAGHGSFDGGNPTIFIDVMPDEPHEAISVKAISGNTPDSAHPYDRHRIQVLVRNGRDPREASDTANAIYQTLHDARSQHWGPWWVVHCRAVAIPVFGYVDDSRRIIYTTHYQIEAAHQEDSRKGW